ncbi:hypothetical protein [Streptomyces mirabilis]|uniref:Serine/threonine protein kinase n=1 Tax=Streptomyces mirabilis TaxID=68239 RepID=A0ABU3V1D8_9ACTN|nr:hypothetical protein [Streptomyces mirabilis]MCX4614715.1 hypothetical protein [Streptomyces mirabilis]MCX5346610.1 hypothetical protein [Streptomyces mirabilis]MDU8999989.1 hypothetical protein [Streptomyces mirabilis]
MKTIASQAAKRHTPAGEAMTTAAPSTQPPQTPGSGGHNRGVLIAVIGAIAAIVAAAIAIIPALTNTSPGPDRPTSVPISPEKLRSATDVLFGDTFISLDATPPQPGQGDDLRASARGDGTFDLVAGTNARVAVLPPKKSHGAWHCEQLVAASGTAHVQVLPGMQLCVVTAGRRPVWVQIISLDSSGVHTHVDVWESV